MDKNELEEMDKETRNVIIDNELHTKCDSDKQFVLRNRG